MKKRIFSFILLAVVFLTSCGNVATTGSTQSTGTTEMQSPVFTVENTEDFYFYGFDEMNSNAAIKNGNGKFISLSDHLPEEKLTISGYDVHILNLSFSKDKSGVRTGNQFIDIAWHKKDCKTCAYSDCHLIHCYINYYTENAYSSETAKFKAITEGHDKRSETKNNYFNEEARGYVSYLYIINDNCVFRFNLKKDTENFDETVEQMDAYADYLRESLKSNKNVVTE